MDNNDLILPLIPHTGKLTLTPDNLTLTPAVQA